MKLIHELWGTPPGKTEQTWIADFELDRWQWAEKLRQKLSDRGFTDLELLLTQEEEACPRT